MVDVSSPLVWSTRLICGSAMVLETVAEARNESKEEATRRCYRETIETLCMASRRRVKRRIPPKTKENVRERLFGETFSIGTTLARSGTLGTMGTMSAPESGGTSLNDEVKDIATLMSKLKKAAIDREKIVVIHKFVDEGGEELHYLAEQVLL